MENKISDINDLVTFLAITGMKPLLSDEIWQCYGYKKRPKKGNIWNKLFPKMFKLENFISREVLMMGLIDVLNGVKKASVPDDTKLLIAVGIVDKFLFTTKHMYKAEDFMQNLFSTYAAYLKSNNTNLHESIILKSKDILNKKDFAKFMVGTIKLLTIEHTNDFLLESDYVKGIAEKSSAGNKLSIFMSDEEYKKYATMLEEKILKS